MAKEELQAQKILARLELSPAHVEACKKSFAQLRPAYHNELHCYSTAITFDELATKAKLPPDEHRHGFLAALYHDAQHLMAEDDTLNICSAVEWLKQAHLPKELGIDVERVCELVKATHNKRVEFHSRVEELLHDADVLQTVKGTVRENLLWQRRLMKETGLLVTVETSIAFVLKSLHTQESLALLKKTLKAAQRRVM